MAFGLDIASLIDAARSGHHRRPPDRARRRRAAASEPSLSDLLSGLFGGGGPPSPPPKSTASLSPIIDLLSQIGGWAPSPTEARQYVHHELEHPTEVRDPKTGGYSFDPPANLAELIRFIRPQKRLGAARQAADLYGQANEQLPAALLRQLPQREAAQRSRNIALTQRDIQMQRASHQGSDLERALTFGSLFAPVGLIGQAGRAALAARGALAAEGTIRGAKAAETAVEAARAASTARTAGRAATFPLRHPGATFSAPVLAEIPGAAANLDPSRLARGLEGGGTLASILGTAAGGVQRAVPGVAGNALADLIDLPAQVLPSTYLIGAGALEAAQGRPQRIQQLFKDYKATDFLPALLSGDLGEAASRIGEHPLYAALEAGGIKAGLGRAAGAAARKGALGPAAAETAAMTDRPPMSVLPAVSEARGKYSPDLITAAIQRAIDERGLRRRGTQGGAIQATPRQAARYLRSSVDRDVFTGEQLRRGVVRSLAGAGEALRKPSGGQADVVSLAVQRIARDPEHAISDLQDYRRSLIEQRPHLKPTELRANAEMVQTIDKALKDPNPERLFAASEEFIRHQAPLEAELVKRGINLTGEQAAKSAAIPYARLYMGAKHGLSRADQATEAQIREQMKEKGLTSQQRGQLLGQLGRVRSRRQTLTEEGDPLTTEAIHGHMAEHGIEPGGFLTQRMGARGPANWFRAFTERPQMRGARRTGAATVRGTFDPSLDALIEQLVGSGSVLQAAKNFDHFTGRYTVTGPNGRYFESAAEGRAAAERPEDFGMKLPDIPGGWTTWRVNPWPEATGTVEAAKRFSDPASLEAAKPDDLVPPDALLEGDDPNLAENAAHRAIEAALDPNAKGAVTLIPRVVATRLRHHFQEKYPIEKSLEAATGLFKGTVLPTSPAWITGNAVDVYGLRTLTAGITPGDIRAGGGTLRQIARGEAGGFRKIIEEELGPDGAMRAMESIVPGGIYASFGRVQPYRAAEQFLGTHVEGIWRAAGAVRRAPGVKPVGDLYRRYRDAVFELDSRFIEQLPQFGALARQARKDLGLTRRQFRQAVADGAPAVRQLARGLRNTDEQIRYQKSIERVFGNWGKNGPEARRFLTTWAPFWMWSRAALKFVYGTLPRDHPILTGIAAAAGQMTRKERQKLGFEVGADLELPGFLRAGIPGRSPGSVTKLSNLTSLGYVANPTNLASVPAPQFSGAVLAGMGLDWKGDHLVNADGSPASDIDKAKFAILNTLDGYVPFLNVSRQVITHGPGGVNPFRTYDPSTVDYLRSLSESQQITVPISGQSGSSGGSSGSDPLDFLDNALPNSGGSSSGGSDNLSFLDNALP